MRIEIPSDAPLSERLMLELANEAYERVRFMDGRTRIGRFLWQIHRDAAHAAFVARRERQESSEQ